MTDETIYRDRFYIDRDSRRPAARHLTLDQQRILRERMPACPTCGAKPGIKCISTSRSVQRKRSSSRFFEYGVHKSRKEVASDA